MLLAVPAEMKTDVQTAIDAAVELEKEEENERLLPAPLSPLQSTPPSPDNQPKLSSPTEDKGSSETPKDESPPEHELEESTHWLNQKTVICKENARLLTGSAQD